LSNWSSEDSSKSGVMMAWILIWGAMGLPYFFYEMSGGPEYIIKIFGYDIITRGVIIAVLGPYVYYLFK
jgi:hypothetical protein